MKLIAHFKQGHRLRRYFPEGLQIRSITPRSRDGSSQHYLADFSSLGTAATEIAEAIAVRLPRTTRVNAGELLANWRQEGFPVPVSVVERIDQQPEQASFAI